MKNICIIPARGGSKRIPRKNIKPFLGKPIIAYSIEAALKSELFDEVMVSTDDKEIAEIAIKYGAKVPFLRSAKNSDDFATTIDVVLEVISTYEKDNETYSNFCCLYPTAPFVSYQKLIEAYGTLEKNNLDSVFPIIQYGFPIQRALRIKDSLVKMVAPEHIHTRSQDLEPSYHDAGQFYWGDIETIKLKNKLWTDNSGFLIVSELEAQDIDNEVDWKLAEIKYKLANDKS